MSYGIDATNDQALVGVETTESLTQLDTMFFTDCTQAQSTNPFYLDGTIYQATGANGGTVTNNTAIMLNAFGYTGCSGVNSLNCGTTNNATGHGVVYTTTNLVAGITAPTSGLITKYEYEAGIRTLAAVHTNAVRGAYRLGFQDSISNTAPVRGVYFEFLCNGTITDTTWKVVIISSSGSTRVDTGVTLSASTTYRMYLATEVNSAGTYTTNYKIKNMTTGANTEGTASPSSVTHYPSALTDYLASTTICTKAVTATVTGISLYVDYIGTRIRRPVSREILIAP
jgi:hypothetical protein